MQRNGKRSAKSGEQAKDSRIAALQDKLQRKNEVLAELNGGAWPAERITWGILTGIRVPYDTRDQVVDDVQRWAQQTEIPVTRPVRWRGITTSKFHQWKKLHGKVNEHNGWIPRDWWLEDWEKQAIIDFQGQYPLGGHPD